MNWETFWAIFSQTPLVTLFGSFFDWSPVANPAIVSYNTWFSLRAFKIKNWA
jgi:hypothetical protein